MVHYCLVGVCFVCVPIVEASNKLPDFCWVCAVIYLCESVVPPLFLFFPDSRVYVGVQVCDVFRSIRGGCHLPEMVPKLNYVFYVPAVGRVVLPNGAGWNVAVACCGDTFVEM